MPEQLRCPVNSDVLLHMHRDILSNATDDPQFVELLKH